MTWTNVLVSAICENPNNSANPTTAQRITKSPRIASSSTNSGVSGSHSGRPSSTGGAAPSIELIAASGWPDEDSADCSSFEAGTDSPGLDGLSPVGSEGEVTMSLADQGKKCPRRSLVPSFRRTPTLRWTGERGSVRGLRFSGAPKTGGMVRTATKHGQPTPSNARRHTRDTPNLLDSRFPLEDGREVTERRPRPHLFRLRAFRAIVLFKVGWDQLVSSAGPPCSSHGKTWWACAAKRRWSLPTTYQPSQRHWPCMNLSGKLRLRIEAAKLPANRIRSSIG